MCIIKPLRSLFSKNFRRWCVGASVLHNLQDDKTTNQKKSRQGWGHTHKSRSRFFFLPKNSINATHTLALWAFLCMSVSVCVWGGEMFWTSTTSGRSIWAETTHTTRTHAETPRSFPVMWCVCLSCSCLLVLFFSQCIFIWHLVHRHIKYTSVRPLVQVYF